MTNDMRSEIIYLFGLRYVVQCLEKCWHDLVQSFFLSPRQSSQQQRTKEK